MPGTVQIRDKRQCPARRDDALDRRGEGLGGTKDEAQAERARLWPKKCQRPPSSVAVSVAQTELWERGEPKPRSGEEGVGKGKITKSFFFFFFKKKRYFLGGLNFFHKQWVKRRGRNDRFLARPHYRGTVGKM